MPKGRQSLRAWWPVFLAVLLVLGAVVEVSLAADPVATTTRTTANDFGTQAKKLNGEAIVKDTAAPLAGDDAAGSLFRALALDPAQLGTLGSFAGEQSLNGDSRQGAAALIARGPIEGATNSIKMLYLFGGRQGTTVLDNVIGLPILADGSLGVAAVLDVYAGDPPVSGGNAALNTARYGAVAVTRGRPDGILVDNIADYIYVIGGYDLNGDPITTIEIVQLRNDGYIGAVGLSGVSAPVGGDLAAVIVGDYLYVFGGSTTPRASNETVSPVCSRALIGTDGSLGAFDDVAVPDLPTTPEGGAGLAGARAVVTWNSDEPSGDPLRYHGSANVYLLGGNQGVKAAGASNRLYKLSIAEDDTVAAAWQLIDTTVSQMVRRRELFAATVANGYLWIAGGFNLDNGGTTIWRTVEYAPIDAEGDVGAFTEIDGDLTNINGTKGAGDFYGLADNDKLIVPGGADADGVRPEIWTLDLSTKLLATPVADGAFLEGIVDFGNDHDFHRLTLDMDYGGGEDSLIYFRFRSALAADTAFGTWSDWVDIKALPLDPNDPGAGTTARLHLLNLMYANNTTNACLGDVIPNPSGVTGPVTARWFEYQAVVVDGDADLRFNAFTINGSAFYFATPAGYNPFNTGADGAPCAPTYAQGDVNVLAANDPTNPPNDVSVVRNRQVHVWGVGMPAVVAAGEFDFVPLDAAPDIVTVTAAANPVVTGNFQELVLTVEMADDAGGPYEYRLEATGGSWVGTVTLDPALKLWPKAVVGPDAAPATLVSLDVDLNTAGKQNVLRRQDTVNDPPYIVGIFGSGFRPGRVKDTDMTAGEATDDPTSDTHWGNPAAPDGRYSTFLRFEIVDTTNGDLTQAIADVGKLTTDPLAVGWVDATQFNFELAVPAATTTGAHELSIYVYNPMDLGSIGAATNVTVYVVPDYEVETVTTTVDSGAHAVGCPTQVSQVGTDNPAEVQKCDSDDGAVGDPDLTVNVTCVADDWQNDFRDSSGNSLVTNLTVTDGAGNPTTAITDVLPVNPVPAADDNFDFYFDVASNAQAGLYKIKFDWKYQPGVTEAAGTLNAFPPDEISEPFESDLTEACDPPTPPLTCPKAIKVLPGPPTINKIVGSFGLMDPPVLMQGDPKLVVNGSEFASGAYPNWNCEITEISIESDAGGVTMTSSGVNPAITYTCASDNQVIVNVNVPADQKPGQIYALKITTPIDTIWYPEDPADATNLFDNPNSLIIVTSPDVTCAGIARIDAVCTDNLYGVQGEAAFTLWIPGTDFEYDAVLDLGAGITTACTTHKNSANPPTDPDLDGAPLVSGGDLGNVMRCLVTVGNTSAPGNHTITVSNGVVYQYDQNYTCAETFFIVSPDPAIDRVSDSLFFQPSTLAGTATETIDVYGTNFVAGMTVTAGYPLYGGALAGDDITVGTIVYIDSTHIQVPVTFPRNTKPGIWQISLDVPSLTTCVTPNPFVAFNIEVKATPEIASDSISPNRYGLGQADTLITITGNGLAGITGAVLANGAAEIALTGVVATPTQVTGTLPQQAFAGFDYNTLGTYWDLTLTNGTASTSINDQFTIFANTSITAVGGDTTVCQGETGELVVTGTNFLPNLSAANLDLGNGVSIGTVLVTPTELTVGFTASADLISIGGHALTITNPAPDAQVITSANALTVTSAPAIDYLSPAIMGRGTTRTLTIHGRNFLPNATVTFSPAAGLTLGPVTVTPTTLTLSVTVDAAAAVGMRDIIVTNPDGGDCNPATASRALEISICEKPVSIESVTPAFLGQGIQKNFTITGQNFHPDAVVGVSNPNVTVVSYTVWSETSISVLLNAAADATVGPFDISVTNPGGGACNTGYRAGAINLQICETPVAITTVYPAIIGQGVSKQFTITGQNFKPGATVEVSPSTGLTLAVVSFTQDQILVNVTAAADAPVGPKTFIVTNPVQDVNEPVTCRTAAANQPFFVQICETPVSITMVSPGIIGQGVVKQFTLTGTNFKPGAAVTIDPATGLTVNAVDVLTDTQILVTVAAAVDAPLGLKTFVVENPGSDPANCRTARANQPFEVRICEFPVSIGMVTPGILGQGITKQFTITGQNFTPDAVVNITPSDGLSWVINSITDTQILVTVTASGTAPVGLKTFSVSVGAGACDTASANQPFEVLICETGVTIFDVSPRLIGQGISKQFTITGENFKPNATVTASPGTGLTVTVVSIKDNQILVNVVAAADAAVGPQTFTVTNPASGSEPLACRTATSNQTFTVAICETPIQVTEISPALIGQGVTKQFTIFGSNFKPGAVVTIDPSTGLTVTSTDVITDTQIRVTITAAADAPVGPKTFIVTNPGTDPANCRTARSNQTFEVAICETPIQVTEISPALIGQGVTKQFTIFGAFFKPGAVVTIDPPTGLTVTSTDVITDTQIRVTITAAADAPVGPKTFIVTNPGTDPANCRTARANQTFTVAICETPIQVTEITPALIGQGITKQFTIFGSNFKPGAVVTIDPPTGLTVTSTDVITDTQIRVTITASATAPVGPKTFIVTNPGTDAVNCRTARANQTFNVAICETSIQVTEISPSLIGQGITKQFTIFGSNFKPGAVVTIDPPTGLTVVSTDVITDTQIRVTVSASATAPVGMKTFIVTNPGDDPVNCRTARSNQTFEVRICESPIWVTNVFPDKLVQGVTEKVTITGTNFKPNLTVAFVPPTGLTVTITKITDTTIELTVVVAADAPVGPRDLVVTNPPGESPCDIITVAHAVTILGRPEVTRIDPPSGSQGTQKLNLTFSGKFFEEGLTLSVVSPATGVTLTGGASSVRIYPGAGGYVGPERFVAEVNISLTAAVGPVVFRIANPNGGTVDTSSSLFKVTLPNQPAAPTDLVVQIQPGGIAKLIWQDNSFDETSFFAEIRSGSAPWARVNMTGVKRPTQYGEASGLIKNLKPGTTYYFRVRALYQKGKNQIPSDPSNDVSAAVDAKLTSGDKPTNLVATTTGNGFTAGVVLTWTNSGAAAGKELVVLRATPGRSLQPIPGAVLSPTTTSYNDTSAISGQKYTYQVRLQNNYNSVASKKSKTVTAP